MCWAPSRIRCQVAKGSGMPSLGSGEETAANAVIHTAIFQQSVYSLNYYVAKNNDVPGNEAIHPLGDSAPLSKYHDKIIQNLPRLTPSRYPSRHTRILSLPPFLFDSSPFLFASSCCRAAHAVQPHPPPTIRFKSPHNVFDNTKEKDLRGRGVVKSSVQMGAFNHVVKLVFGAADGWCRGTNPHGTGLVVIHHILVF